MRPALPSVGSRTPASQADHEIPERADHSRSAHVQAQLMGMRRFWPKPSALLISGAYGLALAFIGGNLWKPERSGDFPSPFFPWNFPAFLGR